MRVPSEFIIAKTNPTLVHQVIHALEAKIHEGSLSTGDRLPSERILGEQLGVSRTVVRGVMADMVARGLLAPRLGGGYMVCLPTAESLSSSITYMLRGSQKGLTYVHIHAVRCALEVEIAGLAAQNRTNQDTSLMQQWLRVMEAERAPHGGLL